jgi:hypothetical protein
MWSMEKRLPPHFDQYPQMRYHVICTTISFREIIATRSFPSDKDINLIDLNSSLNTDFLFKNISQKISPHEIIPTLIEKQIIVEISPTKYKLTKIGTILRTIGIKHGPKMIELHKNTRVNEISKLSLTFLAFCTNRLPLRFLEGSTKAINKNTMILSEIGALSQRDSAKAYLKLTERRRRALDGDPDIVTEIGKQLAQHLCSISGFHTFNAPPISQELKSHHKTKIFSFFKEYIKYFDKPLQNPAIIIYNNYVPSLTQGSDIQMPWTYEIIHQIKNALESTGIKCSVLEIPSREPDISEYISKTTQNSEIIIAIIPFSLGVSTQFFNSFHHITDKKYLVTIYDLGMDVIETDSLFVDYHDLDNVCKKIQNNLSSTKIVYLITSPSDNLKIPICSKKVGIISGLPVRGERTRLPAGEVYVAPQEAEVEGSILLRKGTYIPNIGKLTTDLTLRVEGGKILIPNPKHIIERRFSEILNLYPELSNIAELGIGVNPNVLDIRDNTSLISIKSGMVHLGIGINTIIGGSIPSPQNRYSLIPILRPTLKLEKNNGELMDLIINGELLLKG